MHVKFSNGKLLNWDYFDHDIIGGRTDTNQFLGDIIFYDDDFQTWEQDSSQMQKQRENHALSKIKVEDIEQFCVWENMFDINFNSIGITHNYYQSIDISMTVTINQLFINSYWIS